MTNRRKLIATASLALVLLAGLPASAGAVFKPCRPVVDVFDGTRYEGSDLYRVRAQEVSCKTARRVVYRSTYKALGITPDSTGRKHFTYRRWRVVDDLRRDVDRFVARADGSKRVRWLFGEL